MAQTVILGEKVGMTQKWVDDKVGEIADEQDQHVEHELGELLATAVSHMD